MYRQIGNAVAIPVGRALGRELLKVLIEKWQSEDAQKGAGGAGDPIEIDSDYEAWTKFE
jgi:hypothetical protein